MNEPIGTPPIGNPDITPDDRLWAALGYPIPIIPIIVLLRQDKKNRPFIRFHAIQSLALNIVLWVVYFILSFVSFGILSLCFPTRLAGDIVAGLRSLPGKIFGAAGAHQFPSRAEMGIILLDVIRPA